MASRSDARPAVVADRVSKRFLLRHNRVTSLKDRALGVFRRAQREDVAQLAFGAEDELDLALVEMQQLEQRVDVDERRRRKPLGLLRIDRSGGPRGCADGGGHLDQCHIDRCHVLWHPALSTVSKQCRRR